jgi:alpha-galactosidase
MWASLGLIDGSRSSMDIDRSWESLTRTGKQNLMRAWQNGRLWWNDPDCVLLTGLKPDELGFHLEIMSACGAMILSGDDLTKLSPAERAQLRALARPQPRAARFDDALQDGELVLPDHIRHLRLDWSGRERLH